MKKRRVVSVKGLVVALCVFCAACLLAVSAWADDASGAGAEEKFAEYLQAAEQGDAQAQVETGHCYRNGRGVEQRDQLAVYWYHQAAKQGNADGQFWLGLMYGAGEGVAQNDENAASWLKKAADQGHKLAQEMLETLRKHNVIK